MGRLFLSEIEEKGKINKYIYIYIYLILELEVAHNEIMCNFLQA